MLLRQRLMGPIARCALWCALLAALLSSALVVGFAAEPDNTFLDLKSIKAKGTLRIAITHFDIPPFHMRRPDGTFVGKDIDFARELGEVLKVKIVFVDDPPTFDATVQAVVQGRADIALSKLSQTYDRLIGVRFSAPYFELRHALLYNRAVISRLANGGPPDEALRDYTGKIGVIGKSAYVDFATANYPKAKIVPFGSWEETIEALKSGRVDVVYRDEFEARSVLIHDPAMHIEFGAAVISDRKSFLSFAICDTCLKLREVVDLFIAEHSRAYSLDELLTAHYPD